MENKNKNEITFLDCCPLTVSSREGESDAEFDEKWKKNDALSEEERDILSSEFAIDQIYGIAKSFDFSLEDARDLARLVRSIVWGEVKMEQLDMILGKNFSRLGVAEISKIKEVIVNVLKQGPEMKKGPSSEKMSLELALKKFPNLGEQLITSAPLKLRIFPEAVKPSIKNWIADFQDALGKGKHGMMERGNYLFHGENTKRLTSLERRRLAEVLKSLDDSSELSIDAKIQKIVFEDRSQEIESPRKVAQPFVPQPRTAPASPPRVIERAVPKPAPAVRREMPMPKQSAVQERKVENYFGSTQSNRTTKEAPVVRAAAVVSKPVQNSFSKPAFPPVESYEIPGKKQESEVVNKWNPAESVRKRMADENSFGGSHISMRRPEPAPAQSEGKLRFSSPQTFSTEKKNETLKTLPPNTYAASSQITPPAAASSKPAFPAPAESDDLMERMRVIKQQQPMKANPRAVFKITPMGFVRKEDELANDTKNNGPRVNGNVVDLSK